MCADGFACRRTAPFSPGIAAHVQDAHRAPQVACELGIAERGEGIGLGCGLRRVESLIVLSHRCRQRAYANPANRREAPRPGGRNGERVPGLAAPRCADPPPLVRHEMPPARERVG